MKVCLVGGTGFVGRRMIRDLLAQGHEVTTISRNPTRHKDLKLSPTVSIVQGDAHDSAILDRYFADQDVVINLAGILNERPSRGETFDRVHTQLPTQIAAACQRAGVPRFLHMSALGTSRDAPSAYLRSKYAGETAVIDHQAHGLASTIFKPSVIFGPDDSFTRLFTGLLNQVPILPLACANARFQPIYVNDISRCFLTGINDPQTANKTYELGGPRHYTLYQLVRSLARMAGTHDRIWRLGNGLSKLQAKVLQFAPGKPFTPDNYRSMQVDSVCADPFPDVFGFQPQDMEHVAPSWLNQKKHQYDVFRQHAGR